jgi:hypothetical protein
MPNCRVCLKPLRIRRATSTHEPKWVSSVAAAGPGWTAGRPRQTGLARPISTLAALVDAGLGVGMLPGLALYHPDEFAEMRDEALALGFKHVESGPMVRSSYRARDQVPVAEPRDDEDQLQVRP